LRCGRHHQGRAHRPRLRGGDRGGHERGAVGGADPRGGSCAGAAGCALPGAEGVRVSGGASPPDPELTTVVPGAAEASNPDGSVTPGERLGIVAYTNVAPLHWGLEPWSGSRFFRGVPTALNAKLLAGELDLTLVSSVEFIRHRHRLVA